MRYRESRIIAVGAKASEGKLHALRATALLFSSALIVYQLALFIL